MYGQPPGAPVTLDWSSRHRICSLVDDHASWWSSQKRQLFALSATSPHKKK